MNQITEIAEQTLKEFGIPLILELSKGKNYDGGNLLALMEIFAEKLEAAKIPGVVDVMDGKMGIGWTRKLAEAVSRA